MPITDAEVEEALRREGLTPERLGDEGWARAIREGRDFLEGRKAIRATTTIAPSPRRGGSPKPLSSLLHRPDPDAARERLARHRADSVPPDPAATETCDLCGGARFVRVTSDPFHPHFGQAVPCEKCSVGWTEEERLNHAAIPADCQRMTFATFRARFNKQVARAVWDWDGLSDLLISGDTGRGKTHLAIAALRREIEDRERVGSYITVKAMLDEMRHRFDADAEDSFFRYFEGLAAWQLLVIDDLGAERPSEWSVEQLVGLIDRRKQRGHVTVVATNLADSDAIVRYYSAADPMNAKRLASRLSAGVYQWVRATGPDMREYDLRGETSAPN